MHHPEDPTPTPSLDRAAILHPDTPYVRGWSQARAAAHALAEELRALGFEDDFAYMRADVTPTGDGIVRLDLITAEAAHRLITALTRGLCHELEHLPTTDSVRGRSTSIPADPARS